MATFAYMEVFCLLNFCQSYLTVSILFQLVHNHSTKSVPFQFTNYRCFILSAHIFLSVLVQFSNNLLGYLTLSNHESITPSYCCNIFSVV